MTGASHRSRPRRSRSADQTAALITVVVIAAVGGIAAGAAPTGIDIWDAILSGGLAALISLAASRVQRQTLLIFSTLSAALVGLNFWLLFGVAAVLFTIASVELRRRDRLTGAVAGALAAQALLRWPPLLFFGFPSMVAAGACAFLFWKAYRFSRRDARRTITITVLTASAIVTVLLIAFAFAGLTARSDANRGVEAAQRGLAAVRSGDVETVELELAIAETALTKASNRLDALWLEPARLIPVVGQHQTALAVAAQEGARVARSAGAAVDQVDLKSLSLTGGELDIGALAGAAPRLRQTADSLQVAQSNINATYSPWLVNPVQDRLRDLLFELQDAVPEAELSANAAEVVPGLVGSESPRRYLVLIANPGESREMGGFVGMYALLEFNQGRLHRVESARVDGLYSRAREGTLDHL